MKSLFVPGALLPIYRAGAQDVSNDAALWRSPILLTGILSALDVAFYMHANIATWKLVGEEFTASFPNVITAPKIEIERAVQDKPELRVYQRELDALCNGNIENPYLNAPGTVPTVVSISDQLLVHTNAVPDPNKNYLDALIEQIHPFFKFEDLAQLPIFAQYLRQKPQNLS